MIFSQVQCAAKYIKMTKHSLYWYIGEASSLLWSARLLPFLQLKYFNILSVIGLEKSFPHSVYFTKHFSKHRSFFFCILKMNETFGNLSVLHNYINFSLHNNSQQILDGKDNNTAEKYDSVSTLIFFFYIYCPQQACKLSFSKWLSIML